jgi:hypothetical protein
MPRMILQIFFLVCLVPFPGTAGGDAGAPAAKPSSKRPVTMLISQLRIATTQEFSLDSRVEFVTMDHATAVDLRELQVKHEGDTLIFEQQWLIFDMQRPRRAILVAPPPPKGEKLSTTQVFRLSIPALPVPCDWSKWQKPDSLEQGPASWNFMSNQKPLNRTTKIPPDAFELRYKVEKQML